MRRTGLLWRRPGYYSVKIVVTLTLLAAGWTAFAVIGRSWWQLLIAVSHHETGVLESYAQVLRHLHAVGGPLRPEPSTEPPISALVAESTFRLYIGRTSPPGRTGMPMSWGNDRFGQVHAVRGAWPTSRDGSPRHWRSRTTSGGEPAVVRRGAERPDRGREPGDAGRGDAGDPPRSLLGPAPGDRPAPDESRSAMSRG